jgi:hypothetical protein
MMLIQHHKASEFYDRTIDQFEQIYADAEDSARIMAISVHPYIIGAAHRTKYLRRVFEKIRRMPDVLFWTGEQVFDWLAKARPRPATVTAAATLKMVYAALSGGCAPVLPISNRAKWEVEAGRSSIGWDPDHESVARSRLLQPMRGTRFYCNMNACAAARTFAGCHRTSRREQKCLASAVFTVSQAHLECAAADRFGSSSVPIYCRTLARRAHTGRLKIICLTLALCPFFCSTLGFSV